jgi:hypothetical protein
MLELRTDAVYYSRWIWIVPCITLGSAFFGLDLAYALVRPIICAAAIYLCWSSWGGTIRPMHVALIVLAVVFNPVLSLRMDRGQWMLVDLVAIGVFMLLGRHFDAQAASRLNASAPPKS